MYCCPSSLSSAACCGLLHQQPASLADRDEEKQLDSSSSPARRLWALARLTAPLVFSYFMRLGESFIAIFFASHLSRERHDTAIFAGISLAQMFITISSVSLFIGMSSGLETLGSQCNGAKNYSEVGLSLQRCIVVLSMMLAPILVLWYFAEAIFLAVHVERHICEIMKEFISVMIFMLPVRVFAVSYRKYLMCVGVTWPALYCAIVQDIVFLSSGFLFVHELQWGVRGVAWASVLSTHCSAFFQLAISWRHPNVQRTLCGPSVEALDTRKLWKFIQLGTPGMVMICSEWWAYEILTLFASQLGAAAVTAQTLLFNVGNLAYMTPSCISQGTSSLVGNAIGAGHKDLASEFGDLFLLTTLTLELCIIMPGLFFGGISVVEFFTDDADVISICSRCMPVVAVAALADGVQAVAAGVLRGSGKQILGAYTNVACYYLVGIPVAYVLCFYASIGVAGLFTGVATGSFVQCTIILFYVLCRKAYIYQDVTDDKDSSALSTEKGMGRGFELVDTSEDNREGDDLEAGGVDRSLGEEEEEDTKALLDSATAADDWSHVDASSSRNSIQDGVDVV